MHDGDFSTHDRLAIGAHNLATKAGGGALCEDRSGRKDDKQSQGELGQPDAAGVGHGNVASGVGNGHGQR